jgi:TolB-like protein/DNA-binding winged helix-turn-helix (wHTH) protein
MSASSNADQVVYRFDDLELNVGLQRLTRNGVEVPLPKLSFELLLALAEAAPNFVPHRKLLARVWPGLIVTHKTVNQRVKLLRDALGDDPVNQRYILVLRGRGYRLKPPLLASTPPARPSAISPSDNAFESISLPAPAATATSRQRRLRLLPTVGLSGLAALLVIAAIVLHTPEPPSAAPPNNVELGRSVAVLPFRDLSADSADAYLAIGLSEMVLNRLANSELRVVASSSSFRAWDANTSAGDIGRQLGARYLVDGSVQRVDEQLRISARLVDSTNDTQVWAQIFDREIADIFVAQDEVAERISLALSVAVGGPQNPPAVRPTDNVEAYLAYLRGRAALSRWTARSADAADAALTQAIELDPDFAAAYAALYDARMMAVDRRTGGASPRLASRALAAARAVNQPLIERAIALDASSGTALLTRAIWADDASATREQDFRSGLELDPSNGRGITAFAEYLDRAGRTDEGERMLARAIEVDPLSPRSHFWRVQRKFPGNPAGFAVGMTTVPEELEAGMLTVLELDPDYQPALQRYAKYRWQFHGDLATALPMIERALALDPQSAWLTHTAVAMYLDLGAVDEATALNAQAPEPDASGRLLLELHANDVEQAGASALGDAAFANGPVEAWGVVEALRDWAIANGEVPRGLDYLRKRYDFSAGIDERNFRAGNAVASLMLASGDSAAARDILADLVSWIDVAHLPRLGSIYALRAKAKALLLLGETELALETLDASFRAHDYLQWWYTLRLDPEWSALREHPRFVAVVSRVQQHMEEQARKVEALRAQGALPRRAAKPTA